MQRQEFDSVSYSFGGTRILDVSFKKLCFDFLFKNFAVINFLNIFWNNGYSF